MTKRVALAVAMIAAAVTSAACNRDYHSEGGAKTVSWRPLGSWSGRGDAQTDSFEIGYTEIRIRWETKNENPPGAGKFHVTLNSAVSGRDLTVAADHNGVGHDVSYVNVDPHWSYLVINSSNLDWSVTVEEPRITQGP